MSKKNMIFIKKMDEDVLPQPSVSSLKTLLINPKINISPTEKSKICSSICAENMNNISSFWMKIEWLRRYPEKLTTVATVDIEA